jgi:hypothetical protein
VAVALQLIGGRDADHAAAEHYDPHVASVRPIAARDERG